MPIVKPRVSNKDLENLRASGLTDATISVNAIYTENDPHKLATILNQLPDARTRYEQAERRPEHKKQIPQFVQGGGMVIPYRILTGETNCFVRVRPHEPRIVKGKRVKYESPVDSRLHGYLPIGSLLKLRNGVSPIFITEGEKKALALSQLQLAAVGLGGIWCGCQKKQGGGYELIEELKQISWQGRQAYIVFDFDTKIKTRHQAAAAARRLAYYLRQEKAQEVYWVALPPGPDGDKQGIDDFLVAHDTEAFFKLVDKARPVSTQSTLRNYRTERIKDAEGEYKDVDVGLTVKDIHESLTTLVGPWPKRVGDLLFAAPDEEAPICFMVRGSSTYAWIGSQVDEPISWESGRDKVTQTIFDAYLRQAAEDYDAVEAFPHWPPYPRHYYHHPSLTGGDGQALAKFLDFFCPATPLDRSLIMAAVLTVFWGGLPGSRPAFVIEPPLVEDEAAAAAEEGSEATEDDDDSGRGVGKTSFVKVISWLVGGHIDILPNDDFDKVKTRLLSPDALTQRIGLIDNLKLAKFSCAELEYLITTDFISGHRMYAGNARRPNTLTWFLTMNSGSLSKDLAQRSVVIKLVRPVYRADWERDVRDYIEANRWAIIGDIIALLRGDMPVPVSSRCTRWGAWEQDVLACVPHPEACQDLIEQRSAASGATRRAYSA